MPHDHQIVDAGGTPERRNVYAVFDTQEQAREAEQALAGMGVRAERLDHSASAGDLSADKGDAPSLIGKVTNFFKGYGGEDLEAKRYAAHVDNGRVVIAVPADSQDNAQDLTRLLTRYGAFDVTYFSDWTIVHESPAENAQHGMPTYEAATEADEYTTGDMVPGQSPRSRAE